MKATYHAIIPELNPRPNQRLGRHVEHNPLSREFAAGFDMAIKPVSKEWQRYTPALDQGNLGSCTGNAITGLLATEPFCHDATSAAQFNEDFAVKIYEAATQLDKIPGAYPPDDTGSTGNAVCKAARRMGLIDAWHWAFSEWGLIHALQSQPVIVGVPWYEGFFEPDKDGVIALTGEIAGGHEFEIAGVDLEKQWFICWNSWGPWGLNGKFLMPCEVWRVLASQQADVTIPKRKLV